MEPVFLYVEDKDYEFVSFMAENELAERGHSLNEFVFIDSLRKPKQVDLFGNKPPMTYTFSKVDEVKEALKILEEMGPEKFKRVFSSGLLLKSSVSKNSTKKLVSLLKEYGVGYVSAPKLSRGQTMAGYLLAKTAFKDSIKNWLNDYAGESFDIVFPIVSTYRKMGEEAQKDATLDEVQMRIPTPPGAVPPWGLDGHLFKGDIKGYLNQLDRIHDSQLHLALWTIGRGVKQVYHAKTMNINGYPTKEELAELFDDKSANYGHTLAISRAKGYSLESATEAYKAIIDYDHKMKGGSFLSPRNLIEVLGIKLVEIYREP